MAERENGRPSSGSTPKTWKPSPNCGCPFSLLRKVGRRGGGGSQTLRCQLCKRAGKIHWRRTTPFDGRRQGPRLTDSRRRAAGRSTSDTQRGATDNDPERALTVAKAAARLHASPDQSLTVKEVASRLRVSSKHVHDLCISGELTCFKTGRAIRITPAALDAYIAGQQRIYMLISSGKCLGCAGASGCVPRRPQPTTDYRRLSPHLWPAVCDAIISVIQSVVSALHQSRP